MDLEREEEEGAEVKAEEARNGLSLAVIITFCILAFRRRGKTRKRERKVDEEEAKVERGG